MLSEKAREGKRLYDRVWRQRNKQKRQEAENRFYERKYEELTRQEQEAAGKDG